MNRALEDRLKSFGINKKQEIRRLLYEISKRDNKSPLEIFSNLDNCNGPFDKIKKELLKIRFPVLTAHDKHIKAYLPKVDSNPKFAATINKSAVYPKRLYIEEQADNSILAKNLKEAYPLAKHMVIKSVKEFIKMKSGFTLQDYNKRRDRFFIIKEKYDFLKRCPCTKSARACGYHICNLGFGCIYECTYCYLQEYTNCPGILLPYNTEDFFDQFKRYKKRGMRIGTGEFTDSLALDHVTQYSMDLIEFFGKYPDCTFELKTKSSNIQNVLKARHKGNCVISWSVNPEKIIKENEFYSATLDDRINAAIKCQRAGYKIAFHFDPIIYYKNWQSDYKRLVNYLFDRIKTNKHIAWISLGTLRFNPRLKSVIENRFPKNRLLDEEMVLGFDNKLRYPDFLRRAIYKNMLSWIRKRSKKANLYLCMEDFNP